MVINGLPLAHTDRIPLMEAMLAAAVPELDTACVHAGVSLVGGCTGGHSGEGHGNAADAGCQAGR